MKYVAPTTVQEVLDLLEQHGDEAKVIAGGQSLLVLMRERLVSPEVLIGLGAIDSLRALEINGEARVGAMVTHATVEHKPAILSGWPILAAAEAAVSGVQVRNRGTLCGNIAHAFPTADPPAALIASDAQIELASNRGRRTVAAEDFFAGPLESVAEADELVTSVTLPAQPRGTRWAYLKFAIRPVDFAIVGVAVRLELAGDGTVVAARIGLNGAAGRPLRASEAEQVLIGEHPAPELFRRAGDAAAKQSKPLPDVDCSESYKRRAVGVYTARALAKAAL